MIINLFLLHIVSNTADALLGSVQIPSLRINARYWVLGCR
jgi:hypothetical protein